VEELLSTRDNEEIEQITRDKEDIKQITRDKGEIEQITRDKREIEQITRDKREIEQITRDKGEIEQMTRVKIVTRGAGFLNERDCDGLDKQKRDCIGLDQQRRDGATPLWIAAQMGHQDIVQILLKAGAQEFILNKKQQFYRSLS